MNVSRLHGQSSGPQSFGRAKIGGWTVFLLVVLRCYAVVAVIIAVYAFFRAI